MQQANTYVGGYEGMDIYTAINERRTIRDFEERPIEISIIEKILDAGLKAPTNDHMRNWEFVVIQDKNVRADMLRIIPETAPSSQAEVSNMLDSWGMTDDKQRNMYLDAVPKQYAMLYNAGCLILPFFRCQGSLLQPKSLSSLNGFASIWCCIENMLLFAASEGIYGVTRIPQGNEAQHIKDVIHYPDEYVFPCYIGLGYPTKGAVHNKQKEISLKDKIHMNRW